MSVDLELRGRRALVADHMMVFVSARASAGVNSAPSQVLRVLQNVARSASRDIEPQDPDPKTARRLEAGLPHMPRIAKTLLTFAAAASGSCAARSGADGSVQPVRFRRGTTGLQCPALAMIAGSGGPASGVPRGVAPLIGAFREAWLRARAYGPVTALRLPAGYPVGGIAGDQLRVTALNIATDHAAMVAVLIVAGVLAWSRARHGRFHA
ncbi:hypothetical protein HNR60_002824 [Rhodopseudomonas rhenobacensis]|uniref:Uncharacterized protein n=1 Tax=Rhodopseudomonas rhenobacensis TaxID=87461 RepID=A0A7W8DZI3_9BRAD|nr:hypothetical protein [Rhodopseudomonas rhenobacensis]MBB5048063.1 hypothetical protein [Rhodopseudomonas rhenobacensis]